jgi:hypothetical protein
MKIRKKIHDDWATPEWLLNEIREEFGEFFDPCPINWDGSYDGTKTEWASVNYINPPYNRKDKEAFIRKAYAESQKGKLCIMLLPVSTSTKIFHEIIYPNAEIRFLKGRVKFIGVNTAGNKVDNKCGMHDSMLVIFKGDIKRNVGVSKTKVRFTLNTKGSIGDHNE